MPQLKKVLIVILSLTLIFTGLPQTPGWAEMNGAFGHYGGSYDPEALHLVVETAPGIDLEALAEYSGGKLVRTGPFNYITLEYKDKAPNSNWGHSCNRLGRFGDIPVAKDSSGLQQVCPLDNQQVCPLTDKLQEILTYPGVLSAEWSTTFTVDSSFSGINPGYQTEEFSVMAADPEYSLQWYLRNIRADKVWDEGATGEGVTIAVVDTGIDLTNPEFNNEESGETSIVEGYNAFLRSTDPEDIQDDNGHGTAMAGVIAALENDLGIVGIAHEAKIMPIKAMDAEGEGDDSIIADGIIWAVDHGADIINLSIGAEDQSEVLTDALQYARDEGVLLVGASGNLKDQGIVQAYGDDEDLRPVESVSFPGADPNVIAVSAVDRFDNVTDFSHTGPEVDLSAPGNRILTVYWSPTETGLAYSTGTSIAAPMVSAAAALLWSAYPDLTADDIAQALYSSAHDLGARGQDNQYGFGRLDVYRALQTLKSQKSYPSPASLGWEGGRVYTGGEPGEPDAILTVRPGTFDIRVNAGGEDSKVNISLSSTESPGDFPEGITPASDAYIIHPWGEELSFKPMTLTLRLTHPDDEAPTEEPEGVPEEESMEDSEGTQEGTSEGISEETTEELSEETSEELSEGAAELSADTSDNDSNQEQAEQPEETASPTEDEEEPSPQDEEPVQKDISYLYKWSKDRWIRVGGGVSQDSPEMEVTIYDPGIYRAGWSSEPEEDRISGNDRIQTAIEIARQAFPTGADTVIVARADDFPDALAGAPLAYRLQAPIILTFPQVLDIEAYEAIEELDPENIIILGGTGAVSETVEYQLSNLAYVSRIAGANRYATAAAVAHTLGNRGEAVVVNSANFPDAIAAASHAANLGMPILLTPADKLVSEAETVLRRLSVTDTEVIGGTGVISAEVYDKLIHPTRLSGDNRFATSAEVIRANPPRGRILYAATGLNFPDALTGGVLATVNSSNILLIPKDGPTSVQAELLETLEDKKVVALGGEGAVSIEALQEVQMLVEN